MYPYINLVSIYPLYTHVSLETKYLSIYTLYPNASLY